MADVQIMDGMKCRCPIVVAFASNYGYQNHKSQHATIATAHSKISMVDWATGLALLRRPGVLKTPLKSFHLLSLNTTRAHCLAV